MYEVYFENSYGNRRLIGTADTRQGANKCIMSFLDAHGYHSYYVRTWETADGETCVDAGSWSEFFYIKYIPEEERRNYA